MCLGRLGNKGQLLLNSKVTEFYLKHNQPQYKHIPSTRNTDGWAGSAEEPNEVQRKKNHKITSHNRINQAWNKEV